MEEQVQQPKEDILPQSSPAAPVDGQGDAGDRQVETLKAQLAAEKDKYVRLLAEFDNMRKRQERERLELIKYAHEEVIIESLKIYDDLERSLKVFKAQEGIDPNLVKGLHMVFDHMRGLMDKYDVKHIESVGKPFDPNCHEPLTQVETNEAPDGQVMEEFQKGYTLAGRVVRTAKVKVAKNKN